MPKVAISLYFAPCSRKECTKKQTNRNHTREKLSACQKGKVQQQPVSLKASDLWKGIRTEHTELVLVCTNVLRVSDCVVKDKEWKARRNKQAQTGIAVWESLITSNGDSWKKYLFNQPGLSQVCKHSPYCLGKHSPDLQQSRSLFVMDIFYPRTPSKEQHSYLSGMLEEHSI